jgi:transposase
MPSHTKRKNDIRLFRKETIVLVICIGETIRVAAQMFEVSERTVYNHFDEIRYLTTQSQDGVNIAVSTES